MSDKELTEITWLIRSTYRACFIDHTSSHCMEWSEHPSSLTWCSCSC